jgi:hypothetical protein
MLTYATSCLFEPKLPLPFHHTQFGPGMDNEGVPTKAEVVSADALRLAQLGHAQSFERFVEAISY